MIDGGSTDGTLDLLSSFSGRLRLLSERDGGQSDAINKGLALAQGDIVAWLNASDRYLPGALAAVDSALRTYPDTGLLFGRARLISPEGMPAGDYPCGTAAQMAAMNDAPAGHYGILLTRRSGWIPQPAAFWRRTLSETAGPLDVSLHYAMDYEYWLRLGRMAPITFVDTALAEFRLHPDAKSAAAGRQWLEVLRINRRYHGPWISPLHASFARAAIRSLLRRGGRVLRG